MPAELDLLEQALGYKFRDRDLLQRAVTHSSVANEIQSNGGSGLPGSPKLAGNNERLEFLGDSILGWVVSDWLFQHFPDYTEGQLSLLKNHLVSATHLLHTSHRLDLGRYLHLGRGEESAGGRSKGRLLVNALEAIIAAMYLDGGGEEVRNFIHRNAFPDEDTLSQLAGAGPPHDFRAELDRLARDRNLGRPAYAIVGETGPGHARTFTVEVRLGNGIVALGQGSSKKAASHNAAQQVCQVVRGGANSKIEAPVSKSE